jgi:cobalt-zinc-cadmium efflux system membrane fusion protein
LVRAGRWIVGPLLFATTLVGACLGWQAYQQQNANGPSLPTKSASSAPSGHPELVAPDTLELPADVARSLDIKTVPVKAATRSRRLAALNGTLALDPDSVARVHARFAGEVVEVGEVPDPEKSGPSAGATAVRAVRFGDRLERKGQLLAVVWSKELGEKKSELVDALSQLRINRDTLTRLNGLTEGIIPQRSLREAERAVEASVVAVARAEATLRTWRVSEAEIEATAAEADRLSRQDARLDPLTISRWARVEVRAPLAGTVLEKNVVVGDIVDTSADLFKIAELSRLCVWAHIYEEDLPALLARPKPIRWTVRLKSDPQAPPLKGTIDQVSDLIDPNQHTALVLGRVDNPGGRMRAGQFVTAEVEDSPPPGVVEIPTTALVEDGVESLVLVQENPARLAYTLRRVVVTARFQDVVHVWAAGVGPEKENPKVGLTAGDQVVVSGAVELRAALQELRGATRKAGTTE